MRKMLKENKGFSLVELLVAILIMAVIAGTAITLFGGVLNSSRKNADTETAESIKRAVLTYMNSTNDVDLSCLRGTSATATSSENLIKYLGLEITIPNTTTGTPTFKRPGSVDASKVVNPPTGVEGVSKGASDIAGTFGPFLDLSKDMNPKEPGTAGWRIEVDSQMQVVNVYSDDTSTDCVLVFINSVSIS